MPIALPYENATSGKNAIGEIQKLLRSFGVASVGTLEDFEKGEVIVQFKLRERIVTIKASFRGYASAWLRIHPHTPRSRMSEAEHRRRALKLGETAVWSILRDWIKGQITAVEVGMLSFEGAFLAQLVLATGETVLERIEKSDMLALPPPGD